MDFDPLNVTNILLIQKIPYPTNLASCRPISLCNVNMIVNHFKDVLDACIDKPQSAFVLGRLISNNVLLAYEILHTFRKK
ncbi:hypothetical protein EPI10_016023 [Gossypium australe]|uniref:Reverse transcriptase n=1 Tax=Gossypium australe TaxID=47621 RepID=A0A5B6VMK4_9ROSI|nr:hypothetical protein EPI10_016023 [Gossypium australe]